MPTRPDEHGLELEKLYVATGATGGGVGSLLIERSRAFARERAQAQVWLDVLRTNAGGIRLYRRHGFEIVGEIGFATDLGEIGMYILCGALERFRA